MIQFTILAKDAHSRARVGLLETPHGGVDTPAFMPVGTKAAVKTLAPSQLEAAGAQILLSNAYHLALRPGEELIERRGGLHRFMGWTRPLLTDSGGYQVFSLAKLRRIDDGGVEFQSHLDGATVRWTPERALEIQRRLGVDIAMPLDQPAPFPAPPAQVEEAVRRTGVWLERTVRARAGETVFAIVQGGISKPLRLRSVEDALRHDPPGIAIGGLSVGEPADAMIETTGTVCQAVPESKPRYLMGVGTPGDIARAVLEGVDLFDCALPTRLGRNGWAFTSEGMLKIKKASFAEDDRPLDPDCSCPACRSFSRAYLRHCYVTEEILGLTMLSLHNVTYYLNLMQRIRDAIRAGTLGSLAREENERCPPLAGRRNEPPKRQSAV
ncbi:MAG: tRNA guanosine(34) transglycosylase Tgt [Planctomycetes bacterium]|nr:tRNA guanosine(34) transglycosylase Tgt [Planctomycetota bacterium]